MLSFSEADCIVTKGTPILITGASGFIGLRVVEVLLQAGFFNLRCFIRNASSREKLEGVIKRCGNPSEARILQGNLLSPSDCKAAVDGVAVIYHLAAGRGEKSIPDAFLNSVVTTRNLLEAAGKQGSVKRFVSISSFSVYSNVGKPTAGVLDESCPVEQRPDLRGDAYSYAKVKQDEIVREHAAKHRMPYVLVRPGFVYGPGNEAISGRVGLGTFGVFLHLGGSNPVPLTYVENCAEAIVLAGLEPGADGEVFNVVDDDLPSSRQFLSLYKRNVRAFRSIYVPGFASYLLCYFWEWYSQWSEGQVPNAFNRRVWYAYWKKTRFSNAKLKRKLKWTQKVPTRVGLERYFESCRKLAGGAR